MVDKILADIANQIAIRPHYDNFIGGKWIPAVKGQTFDNISPIDGRVVCTIARSTAEDVELALDAAHAAREAWGRTSPAERSLALLRIADRIEQKLDLLALVETIDNGKPIRETKADDLPLAVDHFRYFAGCIRAQEGSLSEIDHDTVAYHFHEPLGVVGQIIPWNFPILMAAWKLAPALATGNCVVLKPAEQTPLTALRLGEILLDAGIPEGVVNIISGFGETAGAALAAHDDVDKVAFTGSTEVGKIIVRAAAGNLKKVSLELGGKSPNIVFKDVGALDAAIAGAANAIFFNHGQCCCAGSRLLVERDIFNEVIEGVASHAKKIKLGPGLDTSTEMGPLVSEEQLNRVTNYMHQGKRAGASYVTGGDRAGQRGYFVRPTVVKDVKPNMSIVREEIFGPVVVAEPFTEVEELILRANQTQYGLA